MNTKNYLNMLMILTLNNMEESTIIKKVQNIINHIEKRPTMFGIKEDFSSLANFMTGYLSAVEHITNIPLSSKFSIWLAKPKKTSLYWSAYIYHILAKKNDSLAYQLTFQKLKEFLLELLNEK